jgi:hypothetical protein
MRKTLAIALLAFGLGADALAQDDRYLLLAAQRTGTLQQEINAAAAKGFRLVAASRTDDNEAIVLFEQVQGTYQYRLIATTRTGTLQKEIGDAAGDGYRVVPRAVTTKRSSGGFGSVTNTSELLVVMEKGPDGNARMQYQVLATERTGTLQREIGQAAANGYVLVALTSRGEHVAIMERGER